MNQPDFIEGEKPFHTSEEKAKCFGINYSLDADEAEKVINQPEPKALVNLPRPMKYIKRRNLLALNDRGNLLGAGINKLTGEATLFKEFTDSKGNKFQRKANGQIVRL